MREVMTPEAKLRSVTWQSGWERNRPEMPWLAPRGPEGRTPGGDRGGRDAHRCAVSAHSIPP